MAKKVTENKNKIKKVIVFALLIAFLAYFIYMVCQLIIEPTNIFVVENGRVYEEESTIGYIIRDEMVIQGENYKNGIVEIKSEGEKVANGDPVFRYAINNEEELRKKIEELDLKIQNAWETQTEVYSNDIKIIEGQIQEILAKISNTNNLDEITEYKQEINNYLTKKSKIIGDLSPSGSFIKGLIQERSSYEVQLNSGAEYVKATRSGIVSYRVDKLESTLTINNLANLNKKFLEDLKLKVGQIVLCNNESGKIVNNFFCYIATVMDSDDAKNAKVGDTVTIRLSNMKEYSATITQINEDNDDRIIIFKLLKGVEELIEYRKISMDVVWWSDNGLKVPNSALIEEDGKMYVTKNRAGYFEKVLVKVLRKNKNYSIVDNYTTNELQMMGYEIEEIRKMLKITVYDEILINGCENDT